MTVPFIRRLTHMARADAHGVLDALEDRALLLKQHLREAELEVQRKRARLAALQDEARTVSEDAERLDAALARLDEDTRLALAEGREDLARFAIRQLLPKRAESTALRDRGAELGAERQRLAEIVETQEAELDELTIRVRRQLAEARPRETDLGSAPAVADEEVEMELLRRTQGREGTP